VAGPVPLPSSWRSVPTRAPWRALRTRRTPCGVGDQICHRGDTHHPRAGSTLPSSASTLHSGPLTAIETSDTEQRGLWRDKGSGEVVDSRRHLNSFVLDWALEYWVDEEGMIPILDFRNLRTHLFGHTFEIRDGIGVGRRSMAFGAHFSPDSPHSRERSDDTRMRKPFRSPSF
jgi:hypothetical protein